jgi:choline-glycine betaine transporter
MRCDAMLCRVMRSIQSWLNPIIVAIFCFSLLLSTNAGATSVILVENPTLALDTLYAWRGEISLNFTWMYVASRTGRFLFVLYIVYRFGHLKLGRANEESKLSDFSYFAVSTERHSL